MPGCVPGTGAAGLCDASRAPACRSAWQCATAWQLRGHIAVHLLAADLTDKRADGALQCSTVPSCGPGEHRPAHGRAWRYAPAQTRGCPCAPAHGAAPAAPAPARPPRCGPDSGRAASRLRAETCQQKRTSGADSGSISNTPSKLNRLWNSTSCITASPLPVSQTPNAWMMGPAAARTPPAPPRPSAR